MRVVAGLQFLGLGFETWQLIGAAATAGAFLIAALAALIAIVQLIVASGARIDQARPYVMVTFEPDSTVWGGINIVVRNVGKGAARNVRISTTPDLSRVNNPGIEPIAATRYFSEEIPLMPPGYELVTFFDEVADRMEAKADMRYTFTVKYGDGRRGRRHNWTERSDQDIELTSQLLFSEVLTTHHAAKALREIRDVLKKAPVLSKGPFATVTEERSEYQARLQAEQAEMQRRRQEMDARNAERMAQPEEEAAGSQRDESTPDED